MTREEFTTTWNTRSDINTSYNTRTIPDESSLTQGRYGDYIQDEDFDILEDESGVKLEGVGGRSVNIINTKYN